MFLECLDPGTLPVRMELSAVPGAKPCYLSFKTDIVLVSSWFEEVCLYGCSTVMFFLNDVNLDLGLSCFASCFSVYSSLLMIFFNEIGLFSWRALATVLSPTFLAIVYEEAISWESRVTLF